MASSRSLGSLTLDLILKAGGFTTGLTAAERAANKSLTAIERRAYKFGQALGTGLKIGAGVAVTALGALTVAISKSIDNADAIRDLSIRIGVGTEKLSEYAYAAKQTGTDIDGLGRGLKILSKNLAEAADAGSGKGKLFEALGLEVKDAEGNLKQLDAILPEIANKFKLLEDGTTKAALAQELFGKSGLELVEFLNQGGDGLDEMGDKARALGIIISEETAAAADEFNDRLADLKAQGAGFSNQVTAQLLPALNQTIEKLSGLIKQGDLAANTVSVLSGIFSAGVGILAAYNNAVARTSIVFELAAKAGAGLIEVQRNIQSFGFADGTVSGGLGKISGGYREAANQLKYLTDQQERAARIAANNANLPTNFSAGSRGRGGPSAADVEETKAAAAAAKDRLATEQRLAALLNGTGTKGSKAKSGKSDAEREAENLQKAYDRQNESLARQIALFGETGEAAQLRYELENGELAKLTETQKQSLIVQAEKIDQMGLEKELGDAANKRLMEESEAISEGVKQTDDLIADMEFELELIGKTNAEREKAIALRSLDANATDEQRAAVAGLVEELHRAEELQGIVDDFKEGLSDAFTDFVTGAKTAKEAFGDFMDDLFKRAVQFTTDKAIDALFGAFGGQGQAGAQSGGGTDWMSIIAGLFGGARATGGSVLPGKFYRVNENGTEMFSQGGNDYLMTGSKGGMVTPSHRLGGTNQTNQFILAAPTSQRTQEQIAQRAGFEVEQAQRRNG